MSTAFLAPVVLWREPASASARRIAGRALIAAAWIVLGGIPGLFTGVVPWTWLRVILWAFALVAVVHAVLAVANLMRNQGVILRLMGTGSVEWPRSIQEDWLRRPETWVDGPVVTVVPDIVLGPMTAAAARVTLVGPTRSLRGVPLFGVSPEDFVEEVAALAAPRGVSFVLAERETTASDEVAAPNSDDEGEA